RRKCPKRSGACWPRAWTSTPSKDPCPHSRKSSSRSRGAKPYEVSRPRGERDPEDLEAAPIPRRRPDPRRPDRADRVRALARTRTLPERARLACADARKDGADPELASRRPYAGGVAALGPLRARPPAVPPRAQYGSGGDLGTSLRARLRQRRELSAPAAPRD